MAERRTTKRTPVDLLCNKYVNGFPHLCFGLDLSREGMLLAGAGRVREGGGLFVLEVGLEREAPPVWVWARSVRVAGRLEALRFLGVDERDEVALRRFLASRGAGAAA